MNAVLAGLAAVRRRPGLVVLVFVSNVLLAALLAVPLADRLEEDLAKKDAAAGMMYGFDYGWWSQWVESQPGWMASFAPDIFGNGFAFKNVDLLLKGNLPLGLFVSAPEGGDSGPAGAAEPAIDGVLLALGAIYLLLQTFLAGGILGAFRGEQGSWTLRSLFHGASFYFGRLLRVAAIALIADAVVFRLNAPIARFADDHAREAVSESGALVWLLGRHALLLLAILFVNLLSSYAKVIMVLEERSSAILAFLSSLGFCVRHFARTVGHYAFMVLMAVLLLAVWSALDGRLDVTGYKSQLVALVLAQGLVAGRIFLRLALLGGQVAIYRRGDEA